MEEVICRREFTVNGRTFAVVVKVDMSDIKQALDVESTNSAENIWRELNDEQLGDIKIEKVGW